MPTYGPFTPNDMVIDGSAAPGASDNYGKLEDDDGPTIAQSSGPASCILNDFGFAIPADEVIVGVTVGIRVRRIPGLLPPPPYSDLRAALSAGSVGAVHVIATEPDTSFFPTGFGGATDLSGLALTPALVNDPSFGVVFDAQLSGVVGPMTYEADLVTVTVYTLLPALDDAQAGTDMTTRYLDDSVAIYAQFSDASGAAAGATGSPAYRVYEATTGTPILTGSLSAQDDANTTGFYSAFFDATTANGFEVGKTYLVRTSATVDGVDQAKIIDGFVIREGVGDSVWLATRESATDATPANYGEAIDLLTKLLALNRYVKDGDNVTLYRDDNATPILTVNFSQTQTGYDRGRAS